MAGKIGRNKKACDNYRLSGRKSTNKDIKQKRHDKLMSKFEKRREEGKTYTYVKKEEPTVNVSRKTPIQQWNSIMSKLQNQIDREKAEFKAAKERRRKNK